MLGSTTPAYFGGVEQLVAHPLGKRTRRKGMGVRISPPPPKIYGGYGSLDLHTGLNPVAPSGWPFESATLLHLTCAGKIE